MPRVVLNAKYHKMVFLPVFGAFGKRGSDIPPPGVLLH